MAFLRTRNAVVLAKIESSEGVDASPSASTDAVLVESPQISFDPNLINTDEVTGSLDGQGPIVGGTKCQISFSVLLKGSGTASTAPEFGKLLKACGFTETVTSTAVPASAAACGAGGSTTTAQLGSAASSTAQAYRGMPVAFSSEVSGDSFITNYTSGKIATLTDTFAAIDADTNYQIPVNVLYSPLSSAIPSLTLYVYMDGVVYKFLGSRGTVSLQIDSGGIGRLRFTMNGIFSAKADASVPSATYQSTRPPAFKSAVFKVNRLATSLRSFSMDVGNQIVNPDNPNLLEGFDVAQVTARKITGSMDPHETLVATRDIMSDFRAGTRRIIHARFGSTAGNRIGITIPEALFTNQSPSDHDGIAAVSVPFEAIGQDSGAFLCFY